MNRETLRNRQIVRRHDRPRFDLPKLRRRDSSHFKRARLFGNETSIRFLRSTYRMIWSLPTAENERSNCGMIASTVEAHARV
jgi:hypothetical protein